jgi:hypothetical protein
VRERDLPALRRGAVGRRRQRSRTGDVFRPPHACEGLTLQLTLRTAASFIASGGAPPMVVSVQQTRAGTGSVAEASPIVRITALREGKPAVGQVTTAA